MMGSCIPQKASSELKSIDASESDVVFEQDEPLRAVDVFDTFIVNLNS